MNCRQQKSRIFRFSKIDYKDRILSKSKHFSKKLIAWNISPVPEISILPAPNRGWTRTSEKRVQDNFMRMLRTNHQKLLGPILGPKVTHRRYACQTRRACAGNCIFITIAANLAIWLANLPMSIRVHTTLLASVCRAMPFSARTLKKTHFFFDVDIVGKNIKRKNWNVVYRGLYSYRQRVRVIFLCCFCMLSEIAKVYR